MRVDVSDIDPGRQGTFDLGLGLTLNGARVPILLDRFGNR